MSTRNIRNYAFNNYTEKTSSGDVTVVNESVVLVNKTSGAATGVTLPAAVSNGARRAVLVIDAKGDAATNNITVSVASSGTINGSSSHVISENYGKMLFLDVGDEWQTASPPEVSAAEIAFLNGVTAGTVSASKAVVVDASSNVTGFGVVGLDGVTYTDISTINAAGSAIGNATAIANRVSIVDGADDTKGVILPAATAGDEYFVYQTDATHGLKIYPQVNSTINDGTANAAIVIEGKTLAHFIATSTTNWAAIFTANS